MTDLNTVEVFGLPTSPYTRKLIAVLRFRRIEHRVHWHYGPLPEGYGAPKVPLLPTVAIWNDGDTTPEILTDTTPIIRRLENDIAGRSVLPGSDGLRFLNDLIEDYADEWLTKAMFHYRWAHAQDAEHAAPLLVFHIDPMQGAASAVSQAAQFAERQIERLAFVGSNNETGAQIETALLRFITHLDQIIAENGYLFGPTPFSADFAIMGQLTQLALVDPTPMEIIAKHAPRVRAWVDRLEDLSGMDMPEVKEDEQLGLTSTLQRLKPLLEEIMSTYGVVMAANYAAKREGQAAFEIDVEGDLWRPSVFPYQAKCLEVLRASFNSLPSRDIATISHALGDKRRDFVDTLFS